MNQGVVVGVWCVGCWGEEAGTDPAPHPNLSGPLRLLEVMRMGSRSYTPELWLLPD